MISPQPDDHGNSPRRPGPTRDTVASGTVGVIFSFALGGAMMAMPLIAVRAGYSGVAIGLLTAVSAVSQITVRLFLGMIMRRWGDWTLVAIATLLLGGSCAVLAASTSPVFFLSAQLLVGMARAGFWTGLQTHAVRGSHSVVGALGRINFLSSLGSLSGPLAAGILIQHGGRLTMTVFALISLTLLVPSLMLDRLGPFAAPPDRPPGRLWRRPGVSAGCWAGVTAGSWRALLSSYVPVALDEAQYSSTRIGLLVSAASGASTIGSVIVVRISARHIRALLVSSTIATGLGVTIFATVTDHIAIAAAFLAVSGLGVGVVQTLGPAVAVMAVHPEERGDAMAATGSFRALALFASPLAVAGMLTLMPLVTALMMAGVLIAIPSVTARRLGTAK